MSSSALAQVDPSSALLLRSSGKSPSRTTLDSSRFTIKTLTHPTARPPADVRPQTNVEEPVVNADADTGTKAETITSAPKTTPDTTANASTEIAPTEKATPPPKVPEKAKDEGLGEQMKVLILGGDEDQIEKYKEKLHPLDPRVNIVELSLAPSYFYNNSSSNYSFRKFSVSAPALNIDADIWLSPFFGIHGSYFTSFDGTVRSAGPKQNVSADYQNTHVRLQFRKHFGLYRKAPSLTWGIGYYEQSMHIPADTSDRVSTDTTGLTVSLEARLPKSLAYSHILGVELRPRSTQKEKSADDVKSGDKVETGGLSVWVGGSYLLDRQNQIFWRLTENIEHDAFTGDASAADPATGTTPNGVTVTNSMTIFSLGYRWGK